MKRNLFIAVLFSLLIFSGITVSADTDGTYVYSVSGNAATITGVADKNTFTGSQIIPASLGGYPVTMVAENAFADCIGLTSITVPDSVTSIGNGAFKGCNALEEITLPKDTYGSDVASVFGYIFGFEKIYSTTVPSKPAGTIDQNYKEKTTTSYEGKPYYNYYYYYIPTTLKKVIITNDTGISANAFYNCANIKEIILNDEITSVGNNAFYNCQSLISITIPSETTSIGSSAFYNCDALANVVIPDRVTSIGNSAFSNCSNLTNVTLSENITRINNYAFDGCSKLKNVPIPVSVTTIENYAFRGCASFTEIKIPDSVECVGSYAFSGCSNVINLYIGNSVKTIGEYAFGGYSKIASITVPDSVTSIGNGAFKGCNALEEITLPKDTYGSGTASVFGYIFGYEDESSSSASNVPTAPTGTTYQNYCAQIYSSTYYHYYYYIPETLKKVTITNDTEINVNAFYNCKNIKEIILNDEITSVGNNAFYNCQSLISITIPSETTSIGSSAFSRCYALTNVIIPNKVTTLGSSAFYGCSNLTGITLSDNITQISSSVFDGCSKLQNVSIPDLVTTIGSYAFRGCTSFTEIKIPDSVESVGSYAFSGCSNVINLYIGNSVKTIGEYAFERYSKIASITVPDSVTSIGNGAFKGCNALEEITLPKDTYGSGVASVFGYIFGYEKDTSSRTAPIPPSGTTYQNYREGSGSSHYYHYYYYIPETLKKATINNDTEINANAFYNCKNIKEIILNDEITSVGENAFYNCAWYNALTEEFETIGDGVLIKCNSSQTNLVIPDNVKHIASRVFYDNTRLTGVTFPEGLESIGSYAFFGVSQISTYTIPNSVTSIGTSAFGSGKTIRCYSGSYAQTYAGNNKLSISLINETETIGTDTFYYIINADNTAEIVGCSTTSTAITIPLTLGGVRVTKIGDSGFKNCTTITGVTITSNIIEIGSRAFYGCTAIEDVTIPTTVVSVGDYAFYGCTNLETVTISEGLKSIGNYVFYNCTSLVEITLPDTLETLGSHAFYGCTSANSVTIGVNLVGIEDYTFYGCTNLSAAVIGTSVAYIGDYAFYNIAASRISLPSSVKSIGNHAFENCTKLARMQIRNGLESIGDYAFSGDIELYQISIPDSINKIGEYAFNNCAKLTDFTVPDNVTRIERATFNGCSTLADVTLGENTTYIGKNAFSGCAFEKITLPETLTQIDDNAFSNCKNLIAIYIPDSVEKVGMGAFYQCNALNAVSVADQLESLGKSSFYMTDNVSIEIRNVCGTVTNGLFADQNIASVTMNEGITEIGDYAFSGCQILSTVHYPQSLVRVGDYAFYDTISYIDAIFPDNVEYIGAYTFGNSSYLAKVGFSDKVKEIGDNAFFNCKNLIIEIRYVDGTIEDGLLDEQNVVYISLPDTITSVGNLAFNAQNEVDLTIRCEDGTIDDGLLKNEAGINRTGTIVNVFVNDGVSTIGTSAFENSAIQSIVFDGNINGINDYAFYNCLKLTSVDFGGTLGAIGNHAFDGCKILPEMTLPETVTSIGAYAFYDCNSMKNINIPEKVSKIEEYTFYGCSSLQEAIMPAVLESIGSYAYYGCTALSKLQLNSNLNSIGDYVFYNCNLLTDINLPNCIESIGSYAFRGCIGLTHMIVPDKTAYLGEGAFYACTTLQDIYLGELLTSINDKMFYGCVALKKATLSNNTDYIEEYAFYGADDCVLYCANNDYVRDYADYNFLQYYDTAEHFTLTVTAPAKTEYYQGDELDLTGMTVTADYNGEITEIPSGYNILGYDADVIGEQVITVEYNNQRVEFKVYVLERVCEEITVVPPTKTKYYTGQPLDLSGMVVTATYSGGITAVIDSDYTIEGYDNTKSGEQTITVTYAEKTVQFSVTVIEKAIKGISTVKTSKGVYAVNEEFDSSTIRLLLLYNDGTTSEIPYDEDSMDITGFDSSKWSAKQTLTLSYGEFKTTFDISIVELNVVATTKTVNVGNVYDVEVQVYPEEFSNELIWHSSEFSIASVENGTVTAHNPGTAIIFAEINNVSTVHCTITVKAPATGIKLDKETLTLEKGKTSRISASMLPANTTDSISWTSSNSDYATVAEDGTVTAHAIGQTIITATTTSGQKAYCTINVVKPTVPVTSLTLDKTHINITKDDTVQITATITPDNATNQALTWTSSDKNIATVDDKGVVSAIYPGTAYIYAKTSSGIVAQCTIIVEAPAIEITLNKNELTLEKGNTEQLTLSVLPECTTDHISWNSSNAEYVSVSEDGTITAHAIGQAIITVTTTSGKTAYCTVNVIKGNIPVTYIAFDKSELVLNKDDNAQIKATILPSDATDQTLSWSSSNESIVTVDENGSITAIYPGTAYIYAKTSSGIVTQCTIDVKAPATNIALNKTEITLTKGSSEKLISAVLPEYTTDTISWTSSNSSYVIVLEDGTVTANTVGQAVVTAVTTSGQKAYCTVNVVAEDVPVVSVTLDKIQMVLNKDDSAQLTATISPSNATLQVLTWESTDENVATVDDKGVVTAVYPGVTYITATDVSGVSAQTLVTVKAPASEITLDKSEITLQKGFLENIKASVFPEYTTDCIVWTSSNDDCATVTNDGTIIAKAAGQAIITATTSSGKKAYCTVSVVNGDIPVETVAIDKSELVLNKDQVSQLTATVLPKDATNRSVVWVSSNENIVTVTENGLVTAKYPGIAYVSATTASGISDQILVTVKMPATEITINKSETTLQTGYSEKLVATMLPEYTTDTISWTSSNTDCAIVSNDGTITAKASGQVIITATTSSGKKAYCTVTITNPIIPVSSVTFEKATLVMTKTESLQLKATVAPENASNQMLSWSSSSDTVASVNDIGVVTANSEGVAIIKATANNGIYHECIVKVVSASGPSVILSDAKASPDGTVQVKAGLVKNPGISGYKFTVKYDESILTPVKVTNSSNFGGSITTNLDDSNRTGLNIVWCANEDVYVNGELFTIDFKVSDTAEYGDTSSVSVEYGAKDICNTLGECFALYIDGATISLEEPIPGDIYEDNEVTIYDLNLLSRYITSLETFTERQTEAADVNNDGDITVLDVIKMAQHLTGWSGVQLMSLDLYSTEDLAAPVISIGTAPANETSEAEIPVCIKGNTGIAAYRFVLDYNAEDIEILSITPSDLIDKDSFNTNLGAESQAEDGLIVTSRTSGGNVTDDGVLFTIKVRYKNPTDTSVSPISIIDNFDNLGNENTTYVTATYETGYALGDGYIVANKVVGDTNFSCELYFDDSYAEQSAKAIIAFYDGDGRMVQLMPKDITVKPGKVDLSIDYDKKAYATYKLMIWEGMNSLKPITEFKEY